MSQYGGGAARRVTTRWSAAQALGYGEVRDTGTSPASSRSANP
jgi:hypothetical protein